MTNMVFFEDATVLKTEKGVTYKVILAEEDCTIYLLSENVHQIAKGISEGPEMVALLLAYIEYVRQSNGVHFRRLKEEEVVEATLKLLEKHPIETLIVYIKGMKWHQVKKIMTSPDPLYVLECIENTL